jgi:CDP-4-dehydro-6-deoxyglucose reductase
MLFMAGGTGFAPIKALIEHCLHAGIDRPMVLYWGVHSLKDLYMRDLPGRWQQGHADFTFIPVLSDPLPEDQWNGRTGLVHQAVLDDFPDLSGWQVYACGAAAMTDIARKTFVEERKLPEDEFYCDAFTPSVDPRK